MAQKKIWIMAATISLIVVSIVFLAPKKTNAPATSVLNQNILDTFAKCISNSGAKFYGASWCSHCQNQKKLFNNSKDLPYVECSTPDGKGQTQECADKKIEGYPTWIFADGGQESGELTFQQLSEKTNCALPQ